MTTKHNPFAHAVRSVRFRPQAVSGRRFEGPTIADYAELETWPCDECEGTGSVDTPFSGSDPCCPECDGEGVVYE